MTKNQEYSNAVSCGNFPAEFLVPLDDSFIDNRGEIVNLLLTSITSVARITSKAGTVRANHFHKTDWHYAYVESGEILYFERPIGDSQVPAPHIYSPGEMFFTRPNVEHAMLFSKDTVFFTFAKNERSHDTHEADLVRVPFITPDLIQKYMP
jgi:quercetin dioxygenase-like cupin family protein